MLDAAGANVVKHRKKGVCRGRAARNARRQAVFAGDSEGEKTEATYMIRKITDSVLYIGADDRTIDLFEGQYVVPEGMSYNSYLVKGTQCAVLDAVDKRAGAVWLDNLAEALEGRAPDYFVILHMEPDHSGSAGMLLARYPDMKIVGNEKTFALLRQFFGTDFSERCITVKENDTLSLGDRTLTFLTAPMVHWPEVMVAYDGKDKILFSADAFGKFGAQDADEPWLCEARRYYFNIVGKYGAQVQMLLRKAAALDIAKICPLHGPILTENLPYYLGKYDVWSRYVPEERGVVIAYASIHGNTAEAAHRLAGMLREKGVEKVTVTDLARSDPAEAAEDAFRYDRLVLAASSYDAGVFPPMEHFLLRLLHKNFQNRTVAYIENGTWAPSAMREMKKYVAEMKNIRECAHTVTIRSALNRESEAALAALCEELAEG